MGIQEIQHLTFNPLWGCSNPHIQTILAGLIQPDPEPPYETLMVDIGQSDRLCCCVSTPPAWHEKQKTVVMVHGLGGSQKSIYMIRLSQKLYNKGIKAVRVNLRNCGLGAGLSHLPYHSGNSADIVAVLRYLKNALPHSPIVLAGFSLGGNIVLKLLGENAETCGLVSSAISICPPLDLEYTVHTLSQGMNRLYQHYYLRQLKKQSTRWMRGKKVHTLYEYDQKITAVEWGFRDAEEYYQTCSSMYFLPKIQCPCQVLFSEDDPMVDYRVIQRHANPLVKVWLSPHGGHMGFFCKDQNEHGHFWLDQVFMRWVDG